MAKHRPGSNRRITHVFITHAMLRDQFLKNSFREERPLGLCPQRPEITLLGSANAGMFSRHSPRGHVSGPFLNLQVSDPAEAVLSFWKHSDAAQEDGCVTFAHS